MIFTFDTLPIQNKDELRQNILTLFERDIAMVSCMFSSRNYVFIFGEGCFPAVIRVGIEMPHHKVEDILSELMWIDDLKIEVPNVCQAIPSQRNRLVERVVVGETVYLVTMFRKANGAVLSDKDWDNHFFYNAGALLGKIHRTSSEGYRCGFRYKRKCWDESPYFNFSLLDECFPPSVRQESEIILQKIKQIPKDPRWYGMIHGDFHNGNLFCDWGELWAFDFDDCCYGYFMFDVACMMHVYMYGQYHVAAHPEMNTYERLMGENGALTLIRAGYTSEYPLPDEFWDTFDDFFRIRTSQAICIQIVHKIFPSDFIVALGAPMLEFLKYDRRPLYKVDDIQAEELRRLTPEMMEKLRDYIV